MDLLLKIEPERLEKIFLSLNFKKRKRKKYNYYYLKTKGGRFHAMFASVKWGGWRTYCDLHFDSTIHFLFFAVDFKNKPEIFFENNIKELLENRRVRYRIEKVSWFSKRNKSVFTGFRL
jgi:hypothetical protein